jgi:putative oxidoreductase
MAHETTEKYTHTQRGIFPEVVRRGLSEQEPAPVSGFAWAERIPTLERYGALAGRILIAAIFLMSGTAKFLDWNKTAGMMEKHGMVLINVLLPAAALFELVGGLSLLLGYKSRIGALLLMIFLVPTTLVFHAFWNYEGEQFQMQMINFMKNLAIMGGLCYVLTFGSGLCSLDAWQRKPATRPV